MTDLVSDLRFALRQLAKRPGFTLVVVGTLALGIGANAAIFSVVDGALLRPLPYRDPDRLMAVYSQFPDLGFEKFWISPPEYTEFRRWATSFAEVGAYRVGAANVSGGDEPQRVTAARASASLFAALGVEAALGRAYTAEEDVPGAEPVAVLGDDLWRRSFGADPALVGRTIQVNGAPRTLVGVMPPGFDVEDAGVELWVPLALDPSNPGNRGNHYLYLIGRLAPGVSLGRAREELGGLLRRWREEFPDTHVPNPERHAFLIVPLLDDLVGAARPAMLVLGGAVGLVLLIACANVANLLLARAEARQREVAVRTALGAGRARLARQFLTESVLLALAGGSLGLGLAIAGVNAVLAANPASVVRVQAIGLDGRVLAFTLAVATATGLLFGLAPALHSRARAFFDTLKEGARSTAGRGRRLVRSGLVVAEVALAAVLVIGAGLLLKSFWTLQQVEAGFDPRGVLTFQLALPEPAYPKPEDVEGFYQRLSSGLAALPGVEAVAAMSDLPPKRDVDANDTEFEGVPTPPAGPIHNVDYYQFVSPGYFQAMRIPVLAGRAFTSADVASETAVAVVSRRLAEVFWPGADPLGKRLRPEFGPEIPWFSVVGVVGDVKEGGLNRPAGTELYLLADQALVRRLGFSIRSRNLVVRTAGDPLAVAAAARAQVRRLDPALPLAGLQPLERVVGNSVAGSLFLTLLVAVFGAVALLLAAVGTYGVLSFAVEERRHEMGVRLALGARSGAVLRLVLRQGMRLAGAGLAGGLAAAVAFRRLIQSVLFETAPTDPLTLGGVAALLAGVALVACWLPARRATRVDPMVTLRSE